MGRENDLPSIKSKVVVTWNPGVENGMPPSREDLSSKIEAGIEFYGWAEKDSISNNASFPPSTVDSFKIGEVGDNINSLGTLTPVFTTDENGLSVPNPNSPEDIFFFPDIKMSANIEFSIDPDSAETSVAVPEVAFEISQNRSGTLIRKLKIVEPSNSKDFPKRTYEFVVTTEPKVWRLTENSSLPISIVRSRESTGCLIGRITILDAVGSYPKTPNDLIMDCEAEYRVYHRFNFYSIEGGVITDAEQSDVDEGDTDAIGEPPEDWSESGGGQSWFGDGSTWESGTTSENRVLKVSSGMVKGRLKVFKVHSGGWVQPIFPGN